jgi:hypothetical protein
MTAQLDCVRNDLDRPNDLRRDHGRQWDEACGDDRVTSRLDRRPSREEFSVGPYQVQHIPTGVKFGAYPGENDVCYINWGRLGDLCAAQDYCDELKRIARQLLRERPKY